MLDNAGVGWGSTSCRDHEQRDTDTRRNSKGFVNEALSVSWYVAVYPELTDDQVDMCGCLIGLKFGMSAPQTPKDVQL